MSKNKQVEFKYKQKLAAAKYFIICFEWKTIKIVLLVIFTCNWCWLNKCRNPFSGHATSSINSSWPSGGLPDSTSETETYQYDKNTDWKNCLYVSYVSLQELLLNRLMENLKIEMRNEWGSHNERWVQTSLRHWKDDLTCIHRRMISGMQHLRQRPLTMYVAGSSKEPSLLEYQASNREISIVTPAWNRTSSPSMMRYGLECCIVSLSIRSDVCQFYVKVSHLH